MASQTLQSRHDSANWARVLTLAIMSMFPFHTPGFSSSALMKACSVSSYVASGGVAKRAAAAFLSNQESPATS